MEMDGAQMIFLAQAGSRAYRRKESPVVNLAAGAAPGVLPELLDDRPEDWLGWEKAGSPKSPFHAGLGNIPGVEVVVVHEERG